MDPKIDLKTLEEITKLPTFTIEKDLPQQIDDLAVVLKSTDVDNLPDFLKFINENSYMLNDLKKKESLFIYGRAGDKFKRCFIKLSKFSDFSGTLSDAGTLTRQLLGNLTTVRIYFSPSITSEQISTFIHGMCLTNYRFDRKTEASTEFQKITSITIYHLEFNLSTEEWRYIIESAKYPLFCREIINSRALEANPETMLELCRDIARNNSGIKIETIIGKELQEKGLNLIYSVGRGGSKASSLVILKYEGKPENPEDLIAFVGKGVCFDSGGLNIKPTGSIEYMYADKGGACAVLSAFKGIAEMKLPVNIVCAMAFVENLLGPDTYHPLDIIKSYKGLTVEIGNTDAEGRLILADAMSYVQVNYKPHTLIEMSTLTGAITAAIGRSLAGLFTNSKTLGKQLKRAGKECGELLFKMPLSEEHKINMKGVHGDLNNMAKVKFAGASNAAGFLEYFVEKGVNWAHLDIAGKGTEVEKYVYSVGSMGYGVQLLFSYIKNRNPEESIEPNN